MFEKIKKIIQDNTEIDCVELTGSTSLKDDLDLDSFEIAQLICNIEDELGVEIPDYELKEITDENIKSNYDKIHSDSKSLIYGRYIVARFIFNNDKRIKFEGVTFITNNY